MGGEGLQLKKIKVPSFGLLLKQDLLEYVPGPCGEL